MIVVRESIAHDHTAIIACHTHSTTPLIRLLKAIFHSSDGNSILIQKLIAYSRMISWLYVSEELSKVHQFGDNLRQMLYMLLSGIWKFSMTENYIVNFERGFFPSLLSSDWMLSPLLLGVPATILLREGNMILPSRYKFINIPIFYLNRFQWRQSSCS